MASFTGQDGCPEPCHGGERVGVVAIASLTEQDGCPEPCHVGWAVWSLWN